MAVHVVVAVLAAAAMLMPVRAVPASSFLNCFMAGVNPAMTTMPVGPAFDLNVNVLCPATCLQQGFAYAGITEGTHCFCSSDVSTLTVTGTCDEPCTDGTLQCGAVDSNVVAVFSTGGGSPNFTFVASNTAASITVTLTPVSAGATFLIDLGVEAPPSYANQTTLTTDPYLVPGVYDVLVLSMIEGTSLTASGSTSLLQTGVPSVDQVGCPIVWEPSKVYYCNVSVTMANASNSFTGTFSDDASQFAITGIGSEVYRRGTPPPRGLSPSVAAPDSTVDEIRKPFTVTKPSKIFAFDMYAYDVGAFTVSVKRPACSGGVYSVDAGGCLSVPPDDPLGITHTCPATDVFWPQQPTCSSAAGVALSATPATWSDLAGTLVSGTFAAVGFHRELLAAPVDLLPGDAIAIIGPVGKSLEVRTVGDTVAGAATTSLHYLSAIIKETMPIQLSHSCTTVNLDVDLQVADDYGVATTLVNTTSCERNITDVALKVSQTLTTAFNTSVNVQQPFYVRSLTSANYTAVFSVAGPVSFTFSFLPSVGLNYTFNDTGDYPLGTVLYELTYPITVSVDGMYIVTVSAQNKHNIYTGPVTNSTIVYVQHEVVTTWQVAPVLPGGVLVPTNTPQIQFTDTSGAPFPTNASVSVAWGDGLTEDLPFLNPGNNVPILSHIYANDGYFNITAYIYNIVSGYTVTCQIYIVQEIIDFVVLNKYYPTLTATVGRDGFGKLKNQYPMDKNLTFVPLMTQGTVDEYIVINDTSGLEMFRYKVLDPFNPTLLPFSYFINYETVVNMTVHAVNKFQSVPYMLYVEIVGTIRQCLIDDYSDVTQKNEEKTFEVSFESVGAGTCLVVDWGDTDLKVVHSYGESYTCQTGYGSAVYHDTPVLDVSFNLTHTYTWEDVFNVTIYAFNNLGSCVSRVMTLVTSIKCRPPILSIEAGSASFEAPMQFYKSKVNTIYTIASLNCELTSNTRKRWQLYLTNATTGDLLEYIPTMYVYSSWDMPQLSIPATRLDYNLYIAWYTLTMWDPAVLDPSWPFQKRSMTYFEITKTPLVPVLMENAVSLVVRGLPQQVLFSPANFSSDPDYPDDKNFTVAYRCRQVGEAWPAPDTTPLPLSPMGAGGGCFGNGPGLLDYKGGELVLFGSDFVAADVTYEMQATISKDTRTATVVGYVQVVSYIPPVISMRCASASLCTPYPDGVYINPSSRVGLMAQCEQDCTSSLTYSWEVSSDTGTVFPADPDHFPVGIESAEVALSTKFFDDNPTLSILHFSITATGSDGTQGLVAYFMKVNKRPVNGYCNVTVPPTRLALVDQFTLTCDSWQDPEGIGITNYIVTIVGVDGSITTLLDMRHGGTPPQVEPLVLPPGTFTIMVQIFDEWGAFTYVNTGTIEVLMPSKAALDAANIPGLIAMLKGSGDTQLLNMVLLAQSRVADEAPWMAVDATSVQGLTQDEINNRVAAKAAMINDILSAIQDTNNFDSMSNVNIAAGIMASILNQASKDDVTILTIDTRARDKVLQISKNISDAVLKLDTPTPEDLVQTVTYIATVNSGMGLSQDKSGNRQNGKCVVPWSDVLNADSLDYSVLVSDVNMVVEKDPMDGVKCNVGDQTKQRAQTIVPGSEEVLNTLQMKMMKMSVVGETHNISTPNGVHITMGKMTRRDLKRLEVGNSGAAVSLPTNLCPFPNCTHDSPMGVILLEWPVILYSFMDTVNKLSRGTKVVDYNLYTNDMQELVLKDLPADERILIEIPKTVGERGNTTLPAMVKVNATWESAQKTIPVIYTTFNVSTADSTISLEIVPEVTNPRLFLFVDKPRLPTLKSCIKFTLVNDLPQTNGTYKLFLMASQLGGLGRYFLGVGEFKTNFNLSLMNDPVKNNVNMDVVKNISTNYQLRVTVNGVAFMNKTSMKWETQGVVVLNATETLTTCTTSHLTSFGSGMFVMPNTIDFNYVFAHMGFTDNLTIYLTLIITLSIFLIMLIWARFKDKKDLEKLGATPLPDNKVEDKYLYEMLVFTGNLKGAQTDSVVQFIVSGDSDETDVRTLGDDRRKILCKGDVDVFVMAVPRPLGPLQFLRVWHDNSGKGPNASWFLSCIIIRDIQTEERYEFIADQWLAVESSDGQIDRLIPVAGEEQKKAFRFLMETNSNSRLTDEHLWFSVFLRPKRSRFTRCQRVVSCFAVLYLKMLVEAMWYEKEPEKPASGGLHVGPFNMTPEEVCIGLMCNLIVFPPTMLMVYFFRKARPRKLRKSRINLALERTRLSKGLKSSSSAQSSPAHQPHHSPRKLPASPLKVPDLPHDSPDSPENSPESTEENMHEEKKEKSCTLPWGFRVIAWLLAIACIGVGVFFLLMYGITFGNEKTTKWISALVISFFSEILLHEPIKIILISLLMSAIFKTSDLEEDDSEEDEEEPHLENDEAWLHQESRSNKKLKANKLDERTLERLREKRKKEIEMWEIIKEIFAYSIFLWVFLTITYGTRDPNSFLLHNNLKNTFLNLGMFDLDFTKANTTDLVWHYLYSGLLPNLRAGELYNGKPPYGLRGFLNDQTNRIMGYATVRQVRTSGTECSVPRPMRGLVEHCDGIGSIIEEDTEDYCGGWIPFNSYTKNFSQCSIPEFRYTTAAELNSLPVWGKVNWYGGGGYVIHLRASTDAIMAKLKQLHTYQWIDHRTRALLIEFSVYNAQVNLFGMIVIMAEFIPGGGVVPSGRFDGISLIEPGNTFGSFIIACQVVFCLFILYFTGREIYRICKQKCDYFRNYWSYAEISIILASYATIIAYILRYFNINAALDEFNRTYGNGYVRMQYAARINEVYGYLVAFIVFVGTIKFIRLLRFNKTIGILSATVRQCWDDLSGFLVAFLLCYFAFVSMFYVLLNQHLFDFYNFLSSVETCFSMILGVFNFDEMTQTSPLMPILFFIFVTFNTFVLFNLLITVIILSFAKIKEDAINQPSDYEVVDFMWDYFKGLIGKGEASCEPTSLTTTSTGNAGQDIQDNVTVQEFPDKVNKFLDYVNTVYFDGSLDTNSKDALKTSMYRSSAPRQGSGIRGARDM